MLSRAKRIPSSCCDAQKTFQNLRAERGVCPFGLSKIVNAGFLWQSL